jgi:hypothetical protein
MGFTTVPDELRAAGKAAGQTVGDLRVVDYAGEVSRLAAAMPGGNAAGAAAQFGESWKATFTEWCAEAQRHAEALAKAGDLYAQGDAAAASVFPNAAPNNKGPR